MLNGIDGMVCPEPEGAFYAYPDASALLGRDLGGARPATTLELADLLLERAKVAVVPGRGLRRRRRAAAVVSRWATTTWARAWAGWLSCWAAVDVATQIGGTWWAPRGGFGVNFDPVEAGRVEQSGIAALRRVAFAGDGCVAGARSRGDLGR